MTIFVTYQLRVTLHLQFLQCFKHYIEFCFVDVNSDHESNSRRPTRSIMGANSEHIRLR